MLSVGQLKYIYILFANLIMGDIIIALPFSVIAEATDSSKSPEFPIHVVHPYPTILKPC